MSDPLVFTFRVVDADRLVQMDASRTVDVPATVRMAREIAAFHGEAARLPVLLDVRQLQGRLSSARASCRSTGSTAAYRSPRSRTAAKRSSGWPSPRTDLLELT